MEKAITHHKHAEKFVLSTVRMLVTYCTVRSCFERFRGGNLDVKDLPRSGQPLTEKADEILQLIAIDRHASCQDIADALGINHQTV